MIKKGFNGLGEILDIRLNKNLEKNRKRAVRRAVSHVRGVIIDDIQRGSKTGRTYTKYNPKRVHTASREGEAPATDTGELVREITTKTYSTPRGTVVGQIISGAPYSKHLEFGTTDMRPRPFMQKNLKRSQGKILKIFKDEGLMK